MLSPRLLLLLDLQAVPVARPVAGTRHQLQGFMALEQGKGNPNWCWAAVCAMVYQHYSGQATRPCDWATICLGARCCAQPGSCNCPFPVVCALRGMRANFFNGVLLAAQIVAEIDAKPNGRPIVCMEKAAAHVIVIYGIDEQAAGQTNVLFVDPASGCCLSREIHDFTNTDPGWSGTALTQPGGP